MSSSDGVERFRDKRTGEIKYRLRLVHRDKQTGKKLVDTVRTIKADSKLDALQKRKDLLAELVRRKEGEIRNGKRMKFAEAAELWHATIKRHATWVSWGSVKRKIVAVFGDRWLDTIQGPELQRYLVRLNGARSTIKGHKAVLVSLFKWAATQGHPIANPSPIVGLELPFAKRDPGDVLAELELAEPRKMGLTHAELQRFMPALKSSHPDMYVMILTQLAIGSRFAEVSALKRSDFDMETGVGIVRRGQVYGRLGPPKNNKQRQVALPRTVLEHVRAHVDRMDQEQWPAREDWLFPARLTRARKVNGAFWLRSTVGAAIRDTMAELGIEIETATHFARHTLNGLIRGHVADSVLFSVVGHSDHRVNAVYGDARVLDFAAEVERVVLKKSGGTSGGKTAEGEG